LPMGTPAADPADARVMLYTQIALRRLAAAAANLGIKLGAVALAHGRAALRAYLAVKLAAVFLPRRGPPTLGGLSPRTRSGFASYALPVCGLPSSRLQLFSHEQGPFL